MAEYTANTVQTVAIGQNVLFTDVPIPGCGQGILHREGSGLITLRGLVRNCGGFARYKVSFGANIAAPEGTAASTPLSLALAIDGEAVPTSSMIVTPAASEEYWNVYGSMFITVPKGCCYSVAIENTGTTPALVQNVNCIVERTA